MTPLGIAQRHWPRDPDGYLTWGGPRHVFADGWAGQQVARDAEAAGA